MIIMVWITAQFEAYHCWLGAPDDVAFLRNMHRHIFHVKLGVEVTGDNREIEFFQLQRQVEEFINKTWAGTESTTSCEMMAMVLRGRFNACLVEVSEDRENGATVIK